MAEQQDPTKISAEGVEFSMSHLMGEAAWLLTQSPTYRSLTIADMDWLLIPPMVLGQGRIFRIGMQPVGIALWGWLDEAAEKRLVETGRLEREDWHADKTLLRKIMQRPGQEPDPTIDDDPSKGAEGTLYLAKMIIPFATEENKLVEKCMNDVLSGPLKGQAVKMPRTNPETGAREVLTLQPQA